MSKPPYTLKINGPGLALDRPIDEATANNIINLVMTGVAATTPAAGATPLTTPLAIPGAAAARVAQPAAGTTAKQFMSLKKPGSNYERVACLAYYLANFKQTPQFKTKDITDLNQEAAQQPIPGAPYIVRDTGNKYHYLASAGSGRKQITPLGEAVVEALPDRDRVKAALADQKPRRKKRTSKKKKKTAKA